MGCLPLLPFNGFVVDSILWLASSQGTAPPNRLANTTIRFDPRACLYREARLLVRPSKQLDSQVSLVVIFQSLISSVGG